MGRLAESGQRLRRELGTERDDQAVVEEAAGGGLDGAPRDVDCERFGLDHLDPAAAQLPEVTRDLLGSALPRQHPEEGGGEGVAQIALDEHDPVLPAEAAAQRAGGDETAGAPAQDDDGVAGHVALLRT